MGSDLLTLSSLMRPAPRDAAALGSVVCVCYNGCVNMNVTRRTALAAFLGGGALAALAACGDGSGSSSKKKSKKKKK